ncbi:MAG: penicillin-binding protein 2 [Alphaproteobacteria bacterium]|nr:penicillin-binding protein 2 [Alphaproteobacteria bacterium]
MAEKSRVEVFTRRAALLAGAKLLLLGGLGGRLYSLQVLEGDRYRLMAEDNRVNLRLLAPSRGYIVDRYGEPLAVNTLNYQLNLRPDLAGDIEATLDALSRVVTISPDERQRVMRKIKKSKRKFLPIPIRQELAWEEVSRIEVNSPDLPGIAIDPEQGRYYPQGDVTAHVVGYVGAVNENEMSKDNDPALELPSYRIGKTGIEDKYERALRGKVGTTEVEVNNLNREIRELKDRRIEAEPGHDIVMTLDVGLQRFIMDRLADQHAAAAAVMEVNTGDVLALVSTPGYDANLFPNGIAVPDWEKIRDNPYKPQTNKAIAGQYAPGSTFKMVVMLAALEAGFGAGFTSHCKGYIEFGDRKFHCWKRWGHGNVNMTRSIRQSCDIFYYELAQKLGIDRIAEMARRLGLGERTGIDITGEYPGVVPDENWKRAATGDYWRGGDTLVAAIGQGYVLATPLQLAQMAARLATGKAVTPHLTRDIFEADRVSARGAPEFESLGLQDGHLKLVRNAMNQVVNHEEGTARGSRLVGSAWQMAGKTGTSQVRRISTSERLTGVLKNKDIEWLRRDHALFVAFAPIKTPRYAVSVLVEHGGSGSAAAAPVARDIMLELEKRELQLAAGEWPTRMALGDIRGHFERQG